MNSKCISIVIFAIVISSLLAPSVGGIGNDVEPITLEEEYMEENDSKHLSSEILQEDDEDLIIRAPPQKQGVPGQTHTFTFEIKNNMSAEETFEWGIESGHGWLEEGNRSDFIDLDVGDTEELEFTIEVPEEPEPITADRLKLEVIGGVTEVEAEGITYTYIDAEYGSIVEPDEEEIDVGLAEPGERSSYTTTFTITNDGNIMDSYNLDPYIDNPYWEVHPLEQSTPRLAPGEEYEVEVLITLPEIDYDYRIEEKEIYEGASHDVLLRVEAGNGDIDTNKMAAVVEPYYSSTLEPIVEEKSVDYSETRTEVEFDLMVRNLCNIRDEEKSELEIHISENYDERVFSTEVDTDSETIAQSYETSVSAPYTSLKGGETDEIMTLVSVPEEPLSGTFEAKFEAEPLVEEDIADDFVHTGDGKISVNVNQSGNVEVTPIRDVIEKQPTDEFEVEFEIKNMGNGIDSFEVQANSESDWSLGIEGEDDAQTTTVDDLQPYEETDESEIITLNTEIPLETGFEHEEEISLSALSIFEKEEENNHVSDLGRTIIDVQKYFNPELSPEESEGSAYPEETISHQININNSGNVEDTIHLSLEKEAREEWEAELQQDSIEVERWSNETTELEVTPSEDAIHEEDYEINIIGWSEGNEEKRDNITTITEVIPVPDVDIEIIDSDFSIEPGKSIEIGMNITNEGNARDTFDLEIDRENDDWMIANAEGGEVEIGAMETEKVTKEIEAPDIPYEPSLEQLEDRGIIGGSNFEYEIKVTSQRDESVTSTTSNTIEVDEVRDYEIRTGNRQTVLPKPENGNGEMYEAHHEIEVVNLGNIHDTIDLSKSSHPVGESNFDSPTLDLDIGETSTTFLSVEAPEENEPYLSQDIDIEVSVEDIDQEETNTEVVMMNTEDADKDVEIGGTETYQITVMNVPEEGEVGRDFLVREFYFQETTYDLAEGWNVEIEKDGDSLNFNVPYETTEIQVIVEVPSREEVSVQDFDLTIRSDDYDIEETLTLSTTATWFDVRPSSVQITPKENSRNLEIDIDIKRDGVEGPLRDEYDPTNKPFFIFDIFLDGERIPSGNIEYLGNENDGTKETFRYRTEIELDEWRWEESVRDYEISVIVDAEDRLDMVNEAGDAEENNERIEEMMISRYEDISYLIPILILALGISFFVISWKFIRKFNLLCLSSGVSLAGIFSALVLMPWYLFIDSSSIINHLSIGIKITALISFVLFVFLVKYEIPNVLSKVNKNIMESRGNKNNQERVKEKNDKKDEQIDKIEEVEDEADGELEETTEDEIEKEEENDDKAEDETEEYLEETTYDESENGIDLQKDNKSWPFTYHLVLTLTGLSTYIAFLLLTNIDSLIINDYLRPFARNIYNINYSSIIPGLGLSLIFVIVGIVFALLVIKKQRKLYEKLEEKRESVEKLKKNSKYFEMEGE